MERGCPYLYTGSKFRVIWPSVLIIQRGVATTPLRKICLGKTLRRTRVKITCTRLLVENKNTKNKSKPFILSRPIKWSYWDFKPKSTDVQILYVCQLIPSSDLFWYSCLTYTGWLHSTMLSWDTCQVPSYYKRIYLMTKLLDIFMYFISLFHDPFDNTVINYVFRWSKEITILSYNFS